MTGTGEKRKPDRPEIGADRAERRIFDEARREKRVISGVRTRIDKGK